MSLKTLGELGPYADLLRGFNQPNLNFNNLATNEKIAYSSIVSSLKELDISQASKKLMDLNLNPNLSTQILQAANANNLLKGSTEEITAGIEKMGAQGAKTAGSLGSIFAGLGYTLNGLLTNPVTWAVTGVAAAIGLAVYKATEFDRSLNTATKSNTKYNETASQIASMNSELNTSVQRMEQLQTLKDASTISFTEEGELNTLKLKNQELQREIDLQQKTADTQSRAATDDAISVLKLNRTKDLTQNDYTLTETGEEIPYGYKETDILTATKNELSNLKELKSQRAELMKNYSSASESEKSRINRELIQSDLQMFIYSEELLNNINTLNTLRDSFENPTTGIMRSGMSQEAQDYYHSITDILDDFNTIDLSDQEASIVKLDSFFSAAPGRNFIKDTLMESASSTYMLQNALSEMGLTLDDLGVDSVETLKSYLDDAKALNNKIIFKRWTLHLLNKPLSVLGFSARKEACICYC